MATRYASPRHFEFLDEMIKFLPLGVPPGSSCRANREDSIPWELGLQGTLIGGVVTIEDDRFFDGKEEFSSGINIEDILWVLFKTRGGEESPDAENAMWYRKKVRKLQELKKLIHFWELHKLKKQQKQGLQKLGKLKLGMALVLGIGMGIAVGFFFDSCSW